MKRRGALTSHCFWRTPLNDRLLRTAGIGRLSGQLPLLPTELTWLLDGQREAVAAFLQQQQGNEK
jgi:hypothetical protein